MKKLTILLTLIITVALATTVLVGSGCGSPTCSSRGYNMGSCNPSDYGSPGPRKTLYSCGSRIISGPSGTIQVDQCLGTKCTKVTRTLNCKEKIDPIDCSIYESPEGSGQYVSEQCVLSADEFTCNCERD